jgi:ribulose-5-phosphate 4-epimerase/fuculose-1-phosphate aldolase
MLLRNHGTLTCGVTVAEAYTLMYTLENACSLQLRAMAASRDLVIPPEPVLEYSLAQLLGDGTPEGELEWPALLRRLDREDPSYKN